MWDLDHLLAVGWGGWASLSMGGRVGQVRVARGCDLSGGLEWIV